MLMESDSGGIVMGRRGTFNLCRGAGLAKKISHFHQEAQRASYIRQECMQKWGMSHTWRNWLGKKRQVLSITATTSKDSAATWNLGRHGSRLQGRLAGNKA